MLVVLRPGALEAAFMEGVRILLKRHAPLPVGPGEAAVMVLWATGVQAAEWDAALGAAAR